MNTIRRLIMGIILFAILGSLAVAQEQGQARLKIILRYDDYSRYTSMELAESFVEMAKGVGAGVMLGVIPFPYGDYPDSYREGSVPAPFLSPEKTALLKRYLAEGSIEVAMHGFSHKNNVSKGRNSEFSGLPEGRQAAILKTAKASLEGAIGSRVRAFVPPFNQYDATTLKVLEDAGFKLLSAGMRSFSDAESNLKFLPGTTYVNNLKKVVTRALANGHTDATVVVTLHPYDIVESGEKLPAFRKNRGQVSMKTITADLEAISKLPQVQLSSVTRLLDSGEDLAMERWHANLGLRDSLVSRYHLLPEALRLYPVTGLYYSRDAAEQLYSRQQWVAIALYLGVLLITALVTLLLIRLLSRRFGRIALAFGALSLAGLAGIALLILTTGYHNIFATAIAGGLGVLLGAAIGPPKTA